MQERSLRQQARGLRLSTKERIGCWKYTVQVLLAVILFLLMLLVLKGSLSEHLSNAMPGVKLFSGDGQRWEAMGKASQNLALCKATPKQCMKNNSILG
jgi:hypothetical protein